MLARENSTHVQFEILGGVRDGAMATSVVTTMAKDKGKIQNSCNAYKGDQHRYGSPQKQNLPSEGLKLTRFEAFTYT